MVPSSKIKNRIAVKGSNLAYNRIVYQSNAMKNVIQIIAKTLDNDINVMIQGETGTGKELVARAIHEFGHRKNHGFYSQNAGALPDELLESELFGHRRGAFTGAIDNKSGFFEHADGGTVFLDEIGEASLSFQVRLLRFLETGTYRRVGEMQERKANVRIVVATNRDLWQEVQAGRFRADLYYRLCVFPIRLPSLMERKEDIPLLANHFAHHFCRENKLEPYRFTRAELEQLCEANWPGNIRELRNRVHRMVVMGGDCSLPEISRSASRNPNSVAPPRKPERLKTLEEVQKEYILHVLALNDGNQSRTARILGMKRNTFRARLKKLGLAANVA